MEVENNLTRNKTLVGEHTKKAKNPLDVELIQRGSNMNTGKHYCLKYSIRIFGSSCDDILYKEGLLYS